MKDQYVGDVNDYFKYALLRSLADYSIGVFWMLTENDDRSDGGFIDYLSRPDQWRHFDPELFDMMKKLFSGGANRKVSAVREARLVPGGVYFEGKIPDNGLERDKVFSDGMTSLKGCEIIFFDPDNGLEVKSKWKGRKNSCKYLYRGEVKEAFEKGHSLLIYQHFPHVKRDIYLRDRKTQIKEWSGAEDVIGLCTGRVCFFLVPQRGRTNYFRKRCAEFVNKWSDCFYSADTDT